MIRKKVFGLSFALFATAFGLKGFSQKVDFKEYDLKNGLHVVLHDNKTAPDVAVSVMYHVGSKNEVKGRTGFAHFFEHLLFEGSDNIKRGEFMKIVAANGGQNNANTTQDRTFYYEVLPANQLKLGLWLESERMMHPVINDIGVNTQREVVKEEKECASIINLMDNLWRWFFPKCLLIILIIGFLLDLWKISIMPNYPNLKIFSKNSMFLIMRC